jgi:hypothetical protein
MSGVASPSPHAAGVPSPGGRTGTSPAIESSGGSAGPATSPSDVKGAGGFVGDAALKDGLLAEIRRSKAVFYNTVVAQAQRIEAAADRVTFTFSASQRALRDALDQNRPWLEAIAAQTAGRKIAIVSLQNGAAPEKPADVAPAPEDKKSALRREALADRGVQALLEVFPAEIRDIEEM